MTVFPIDQLLPIVQSFGGLSIYGWEFFDRDLPEDLRTGKRISLDWSSGEDGGEHSVWFFQDAANRFLEVWLWFDAAREESARSPD